MEALFGLNGLGYMAVSLIAFYIYLSFCRKDETSQIAKIIGANGIFYLVIAILNFFWVSGFLEPNSYDFVLISSGLTVISSILVLYSVYKITGNRNLAYLLVLFITTVFAINFSLNAFFATTLAVSYLLLALVFLDLVFFTNYYLRWAGYAGLLYTGISIIFSSLIILGREAHRLLWFVPASMMFLFFFFLYKDIKDVGVIKAKQETRHKKSRTGLGYGVILGRFLIFITAISGFIFLSTIAMHELGHAIVAQYYGCTTYKAVIYDIIAPHTEIECGPGYNDNAITLAGVASTTAVAIVFMLTGGHFTKGISYLILGFGLLASYGDLVDLQASKNIVAMVTLISLAVIILAVIHLSAMHLKGQDEFSEKLPEIYKKSEGKDKKPT